MRGLPRGSRGGWRCRRRSSAAENKCCRSRDGTWRLAREKSRPSRGGKEAPEEKKREKRRAECLRGREPRSAAPEERGVAAQDSRRVSCAGHVSCARNCECGASLILPGIFFARDFSALRKDRRAPPAPLRKKTSATSIGAAPVERLHFVVP